MDFEHGGHRELKQSIDEGLQETGKSMSQIPTYVTSVPNGTEKVRISSDSTRKLGTENNW